MKTGIFLTAIIIVTAACSKSKEEAVIELKFTTQGLAFINLAMGKYFIYKDSATNRLDSVVVTKNTLVFENIPPYNSGWGGIVPAHKAQSFKVELTHYHDSETTLWFYGEAMARFDDLLNYNSSDTAEILLGETHIVSGGSSAQYFGAFTYNNRLGSLPPVSMTVEGVHYPVTMKGGLPDPPDNLNYREFYWAPEVGIIKRVIANGGKRQVATLVRHN